MEKITATITSIRYRNDENGWTVADMEAEDIKFPAVGSMPSLNAGEKAELNGEWVIHPTYGKQFKVASYSCIVPTSVASVLQYLSSGFIKGIGKATAKSIVDMFGPEALEVIEKSPKLLINIPGIGRIRAKQIHESYMEKRALQDTIMGLQAMGISLSQGMKLYKLYGADCICIIKKNPYRLIDDVENIGFKTADRIAQNIGYAFDSLFRITAGLKYTLMAAKQDGNTYLPKELLISIAAKNVLGVDSLLVESALNDMILSSEVIEKQIGDSTGVFLNHLHYLEMDSAARLIAIGEAADPFPLVDIDGEIDRLQKNTSLELASEQRDAIHTAATEGVLVITGGPGTGKTTILKFIIEIMERIGCLIELAAPTGRAAKRMSDATGHEARTIHRLLEYGFGTESFARDSDNPIDAGIIIIDEMSMVDVPLFHALLKAIEPGTHLVMVGDADQLPPVGAGNVLRDIVDSRAVPVIRLNEIYRQAGRSMIVTNAHLINHGRMPSLSARHDSDFDFYPCFDVNTAVQSVLNICVEFALRGEENSIQVLSPMKGSLLGVNSLNVLLQKTLNPPSLDKNQIDLAESVFREGDRVMQIKNNYDMAWQRSAFRKEEQEGRGIFNGDIGTVLSINKHMQTVKVLFDDERIAEYSAAQLEELELAYCISVHKSQGSEFPCIVLPLISGPPMLFCRNILYTAVTRAKRKVYIFGTPSCIEKMIKNNQMKRRYSALGVFLSSFVSIAETIEV